MLNIRRSRFSWATAIVLMPCMVIWAQDVQPEQAAPTAATVSEVERVIVTGSIIPTAEEVGPNPVLTINRDIIEKSGERTAEE